MYCQNCGRSEKDLCVHTSIMSTKEQTFLMLMIITFPTIIVNVFVNINEGFNNFSYITVGSVSLTLILVVLTFTTLVFKRLHLAYFFGCHQKVKRSFKVKEKHFVICARCSGLYAGIILSNVFIFLSFNYAWLLLLSIPMIIDGLIQHKTEYISNNIKRFVTGLLAAPTIVVIFGFAHYHFAKLIFDLVQKFI